MTKIPLPSQQIPKQTKKRPDLSIIIPAYREERRIGKSLEELAEFLEVEKFFNQKSVEVLVVAADAPDRTCEIVRAKKELFVHGHAIFELLLSGPHVGKGRDVQYGMLRAQGNVIVFMDADLATPLHHLEQFYATCGNDKKVVVGTRDLFRYRTSRLQNTFSGLGNRLYQLMSGLRIEDTQCGFKMLTRQAAQLCFSKMTIMGWGFDIEILAIAKANNLTIESLRIDDWKDKPYTTYTDGMVRIALRFVRDFAHVAVNMRKGAYVTRR